MVAYENIENIVPPINLSLILKKNNFTIKQGDFSDKNVSGAYSKIENSIYLARSENYTRKVFTIAHELGHYFLHSGVTSEFFYRSQMTQIFQDGENKIMESEANCFAASLLMPEKVLKKYWDMTNDIDKLAVIFNVSTVGIFLRLKHLGLK